MHDSKLSAMGGLGYTLKKAAAGKPGGDFDKILDIKTERQKGISMRYKQTPFHVRSSLS